MIGVRDGQPEDHQRLRELWHQAWQGAPRFPLPELTVADRVLVATPLAGGEPIGMAWLSAGPGFPFGPVDSLLVDYLVVEDGHRGRGAGRALVAAACQDADRRGLDRLVIATAPERRRTERFLARLGLHPARSHRGGPVALVRKRLDSGADAGTRTLIARRRALRARESESDS
jgi:GNAT superfamily N-acetyltransferase